MIQSIKLVNFRNFIQKDIIFDEKKNFIIWDNWRWKTNILEAISLLWNNSILWLNFDSLINTASEVFFIEITDKNKNKIWISYDKNTGKKKYIINWKSSTKKALKEISYKSVIFSPIIMNMMYLSPSLRRDFIDNILINSYPEYEKHLKEYKSIVKNRNKVLKNINEWKSSKTEITFWDDMFTKKAMIIYKYRFKLINYIKNDINKLLNIFWWKINDISFKYITKVNEENIEKSIKKYLEKNLERDIIIKKTNIWPHIDDFDIIIDEKSIINYASRWEVKSVLLWLKNFEIQFIEEKTQKKPILIIDDLLSELDYEHEELLLKNIDNYQTFISSIKEENNFTTLIKL